MKAPSYTDSKEKLIEDMRATPGFGSRQFDIAKATLEIKAQEDVADQTKRLTKATWVLALATVGLVVATIILVFATTSVK
jgi:hypothetical protein